MRRSPSSPSKVVTAGIGFWGAQITSAQRCCSPDGNTEPDVGVERLDDGTKSDPRHLARDPVHHLAHQMAEGVGVVDEAVAGRVPGFSRGERPDHSVPVEQVRVGQHVADGWDPGPMCERVRDGRLLLAAYRELGPDVSDRLAEMPADRRPPIATREGRGTPSRPSTCRPGCRCATVGCGPRRPTRRRGRPPRRHRR